MGVAGRSRLGARIDAGMRARRSGALCTKLWIDFGKPVDSAAERVWMGLWRNPIHADAVKRIQTACKPGLSWRYRQGQPFLWEARYRAPRATNPGCRAGMPLAAAFSRPARRPYAVLLPVGFTLPPLFQGRGALLPHRFTLALAHGFPCASGGLFSVALSLGSPPPAVNRHRIPVEPGLSSIPRCRGTAAARPSGWPVVRPHGPGSSGIDSFAPAVAASPQWCSVPISGTSAAAT